MKKNRFESGQIIVLLALAIVGLLAFAALAVDVGMVSADRRYAQAAADAAATAGGQKAAMRLENDHVLLTYMTAADAAPAMAQARQAAITRAGTNNFVIDTDISDNHGVSVTYGTKDMGSYIDKYIDVKVVLTSTTRTSFAQLFFADFIKNTVTAVVRVRPRANVAFGYAIAALDTNCDANLGDMVFNGGGGSGAINVQGGGIISNSCMAFNSGPTVDVQEPYGIHYVDDIHPNPPPGPPQVDPQPSPSSPLPPQNFPVPDCLAIYPTLSSEPSGGDPYQPGRYDTISISGNTNAVFNPGLYCIERKFTMTGKDLTATGVTIILMENSDTFKVSGSGTVNMVAPNHSNPPTIRGMLVYAVPGSTASIDLSGTTSSSFTGTIYAPDGTVSISGTSGMEPTFHTQLVGSNVTVNGTATINIIFDGNQTAQTPAYLDVYR